ncbi:hypothetical protein F2Q70_00042441 [Brassica cretica]|uniref:Uncharacterized protein n=1 Tax=Brassica cretica TaxID=69181 RepID=A0A8S9KJG6_BRACR|nr:hypothetical protein F2Q70_00042441 [Brassica cretica]
MSFARVFRISDSFLDLDHQISLLEVEIRRSRFSRRFVRLGSSLFGVPRLEGVLFLVFVCDGVEPGLFMLYSASCKGSPVRVQGTGALVLSASSRGRLIVKSIEEWRLVLIQIQGRTSSTSTYPVTPKSNPKTKVSTNKRGRETEQESPSSPPPAPKKRVDMISWGPNTNTAEGKIRFEIMLAIRTLENPDEATPPPSITHYNPNMKSPCGKIPNFKQKNKMTKIREISYIYKSKNYNSRPKTETPIKSSVAANSANERDKTS